MLLIAEPVRKKGRKPFSKKRILYNDSESEESDTEVEDEKQTNASPRATKPRSKTRVNGEINCLEQQLKHAAELLGKLRRHKCSWPFQDPVDKDAVCRDNNTMYRVLWGKGVGVGFFLPFNVTSLY
jgi:hypothetical protein